ncbi:unnamed protein product [Amoebophrya sp. A25]|nr:unnamed protein product [Amoebophrya sp. A25]|eukprot:GSA25T00012782001.1
MEAGEPSINSKVMEGKKQHLLSEIIKKTVLQKVLRRKARLGPEHPDSGAAVVEKLAGSLLASIENKKEKYYNQWCEYFFPHRLRREPSLTLPLFDGSAYCSAPQDGALSPLDSGHKDFNPLLLHGWLSQDVFTKLLLRRNTTVQPSASASTSSSASTSFASEQELEARTSTTSSDDVVFDILMKIERDHIEQGPDARAFFFDNVIQRNNPNAYYPKVFFRQENKLDQENGAELPFEDENLADLIQPDEERISVTITETWPWRDTSTETGRPGWKKDFDLWNIARGPLRLRRYTTRGLDHLLRSWEDDKTFDEEDKYNEDTFIEDHKVENSSSKGENFRPDHKDHTDHSREAAKIAKELSFLILEAPNLFTSMTCNLDENGLWHSCKVMFCQYTLY